MPKIRTDSEPSHAAHINLKRLAGLVVLLLILYVVLPQFHQFHSSLDIAQQANRLWLLAALGAIGLTYLASASIYLLLAKQKLSFFRTVLAQIAGTFTNRLLPAGIGAIGISYDYLRKNKHSPNQAVAVVAANNTIGFIGNMLLLILTALIAHESIAQIFRHHYKVPSTWVILIAIAILFIIIIWFKLAGKKFFKKVLQILKNLSNYRAHPVRLAGALIFSILLTSSYALCLMTCLWAVGLHLSFAIVLIVLTIGVAGGTVVPTPGGLGGAEAGLTAGFVAYGLSSNRALAVTLLYRLLTYWLVLVIGALAFSIARKFKYL
jgi:uncharacterized membrane protein YbhN (UPF0104 family)